MTVLFEEQVKVCLDVAAKMGASYSDVRVNKIHRKMLRLDNRGSRVFNDVDLTLGVRVIVKGSWGFCGSSILDNEYCKRVTERAVRVARAASAVNKSKVTLTEEPTLNERYSNNFIKHPLKVEDQEIYDLLDTAVKTLKESGKRIKSFSATFQGFEEEKLIVTSEGTCVQQKLVGCGSSIQGWATENGNMVRRSYPQSLGLNLATKGYEWIQEVDLINNATRIGCELEELLDARCYPQGFSDLLLADDMLALQIHETVGHPTELDRALDMEWDFAGSTFLTPEKVGLKFGSNCVNVVADATISGGAGSYYFDDEAVKGKKVDLIKDGVFVGYQTSRETAALLGLSKSSGGMRAMSGLHQPLVRMSNINLLAGDWTREEIIKDTKQGLLITAPLMEIFDQRRRTFTFSGEIGWRIKNGEIAGVVKEPIYSGQTLNFWHNCDAIAKDGWTLFSSGCGKGRPHQTVRVGHYCSLARFRNVLSRCFE